MSATQTQPLSVAPKIRYVNLTADRRWGFGFTVKGSRPTLIASVDPAGPAYQAGIKPGTSEFQYTMWQFL